ncbi:helicase protein [Opisthorchis viverrini]|uniref:Helicase protein n=1 Tax=Opisthorchis viverrini TaxID=6198 RepID=A0A1S8WWS2_OPIVI|nr:helicase protein [Opisthorchis viverrini]
MDFFDSDCLCDYTIKKKSLSDIFFPTHSRAPIPRHSNAYNDFWNFLQKLQRVIRSKCDQGRSSTGLSSANLHCLHLVYDMFFDFLQKQKLAKIIKLQRDQAALPMAAYRVPLLSHLATHQVVVVAGDTGCGKSTQVPQYLHNGDLDSNDQPCGRGYKHIAVTQPRRIACISLASRVSTELLNECGSKVGYQVRFERSRTKATQILFLTEGLLLRQMQLDPFLKEYDALVLDEVHERHWQTDCLLGLVKCLVAARPELRVVLMSATINVKLFSSFFGNCPILEVPGRLFPIDLKYIPPTPSEIAQSSDRLDPSPYIRLLQRIDAKYLATERGDLLVFLPGMAEIQAVMEPAKAYAEQTKRWIILPLHSTLSARDQEKVFHVAPDGVRKCVLSTNIAETSLTIDGIRFVADSGRVKELSWDATARMRRLKEFPVSKASADQRKGRAGRTGPGVCYRFYTQEDYEEFERFSTPEIRRVPLETLALQMMVMGLPDVTRFPFIEPPESKSLEEALERLQSHGALARQDNGEGSRSSAPSPNEQTLLTVTPLGRLLADLPVEFSLGRMLIMASLLGLVEPVLSLVAGMSVQNPLTPTTAFTGTERLRRTESLADYESDHGDAFTVMRVFDEWLRIKSEDVTQPKQESHSDPQWSRADSRTNIRRWCRRIGAQEQRLHEMVRLRNQFSQLLRDAGLWADRTTQQTKVAQKRTIELNRARRMERMRTKRRRLLTLQDNDTEERSESEDENENASEPASNLRKWLAAVGAGRGSRAGLNTLDVSVRDLELVLCYDLSSLAESALCHESMTQADLILLKVVLAGGLYPHLAIGDTANAYRVANRGGSAGPGAEMVFHTRAKGFVTLNPNDVFVRHPDVLFPDPKLREKTASIHDSSSDSLPSGYASDHQLLMYLDLMETTKPFLVNTIRVPALPTLLLYCREIDTDSTATRLVFDSWLEVRLIDIEAGQRALATAVWLRTIMDRLMELRLQECAQKRERQVAIDSGDVEGDQKSERLDVNPEVERRCRRLRRILAEGLAAFLAASPGGPHAIKRLLAADVKQLFRKRLPEPPGHFGLCSNKPDLNPPPLPNPEVGSKIEMNMSKGGYRVTCYLSIDSLFPEAQHTKQPDLPIPDEVDDESNDSLDLAERIHRQFVNACEIEVTEKPVEHTRDFSGEDVSFVEGDTELDSDADKFQCDKCGKTLLTHGSLQTVLLRHRRECSSEV